MSTTVNLDVSYLVAGQSQPEVTANAAFDAFDGALGSLLVHTMTDADYTLNLSATPNEALGYLAYNFTGTLTANRNIIVPTNRKLYYVQNNTTGGYNLTVKTASGTGVSVGSGSAYLLLYCDGTNVVAIAALAEPDPSDVTSVFGRTGAVTAQSGDYSVSQVTGAAPTVSPALTGTPTAPTAASLTNNTQIATTAYADSAVAVETSRAETAEALLAPLASPVFTGTPTVPGYVPTSTTINGHALSSNVIVSASDLTTGTLPHAQLPALLSGDIPNNAANTSGTAANLSGTPALPNGTTATTQSAGDDSTKIATTAYVDTRLPAVVHSETNTGKTATSGSYSTVYTTTAAGLYVSVRLWPSRHPHN